MMRFTIYQFSAVVFILVAIGSSTWCLADLDPPQCGGALCHSQLRNIYYGQGCRSQCTGTSPPLPPPILAPPPPPSRPPSPPLLPDEYLISRKDFNEMFKDRDDIACEGRGFYTYEAFVEAAKTFPKFGNEGNSEDVKKREIGAFFGQSCYCFVKQQNVSRKSCLNGLVFPTWSDVYGICGNEIGVDLLNNPDIVTTDPVISFKAAIWFWMNPSPFRFYYAPMPPAHDVMVGTWVPSSSELEEGKFPGYGMATYLVSLGTRTFTLCGLGKVTEDEMYRIRFYKRYCDILGVDYGNHLDCSAYNTPYLISSA